MEGIFQKSLLYNSPQMKYRIIAATLFLISLTFAQSFSGNLQFVANQNQWDRKVEFAADIHGGKVFLEQDRFTYSLHESIPHCSHHEAHESVSPRKAHAYQMIFDGAQEINAPDGKEKLRRYKNYFLGNDPAKWASKVPVFREVVYQELYDCVDLHVYSQAHSLKYDLYLKKGGDHRQIRMRYEGVDDIYLKDKTLHLTTSLGEMLELEPFAYQMIEGKQVKIECAYSLEGQTVSFQVGDYDKSLDLIIDPTVIFASFSGSTADNWGSSATYDSEENAYGAGTVFGTGYPTTLGSLDESFNSGEVDIGVTKFSPDGTTELYTTYVGGSDSESPHSLIADANDNLIILGTSGSSNYPTSASAYQSSHNGGQMVDISGIQYSSSDIVITKIAADGSSIIGSTFYGGSSNDGLNTESLKQNYGDEARGEVIVGPNGDIVIASCTLSDDISTTSGVIQPAYAGNQDAVIARFNSDLSSLVWATYFGGDQDDSAYSIKYNETNGNFYFGGGTEGDIPFATGLNSSDFGGISDGYVASISANGTSSTATYLGTNQYDQVYFVETNEDGNVFAYGQSSGSYPVEGAVWSEAGQKQFIHSLEADLSTSIFSTVFGAQNSINISPTAFLVDKCNRIYAAGWGSSVGFGNINLNVSGMTTTSDAFQPSSDGEDLYFLVLDKDASGLLYATYFGGNGVSEHVDGGTSRFDKNGVIYQAICACGGLFGGGSTPTTTGVVAPTSGSSNCNLHVVKLDMEQPVPTAVASAEPAATGCADPVFTVQLVNGSQGASSYFWDLGNGQEFAGENPPPVIYTDPGIYNVRLIAYDSLECFATDTVFTEIRVGVPEVVDANFSYELPDGCESMNVVFDNLSANINDPDLDYEYLWDFGDGFQSAARSPEHVYFLTGDYDITLTVTSLTDTLCNSLATFTLPISLIDGYDVEATLSDLGGSCLPFDLGTSANNATAPNISWLLDGAEIATGPDLSYTLNQEGEHLLELIINDPGSCNLADTAAVTVIGYSAPVAEFAPDVLEQDFGEPITFVNSSTPDMGYSWQFGDGNTSTEFSPVHTFLSLGEFQACLTVTNPEGGCEDTYCETVVIDESWKVEVPTAFSPNGDGVNDILYLRGFGMQEVELVLFDRWGRELFKTTSFEEGWDGTYKDEFQEIEVVAYLLKAKTPGGEDINRTGNITVLR